MPRGRAWKVPWCAVLAVLAGLPADAQTTYSSRSAWDSAVAGQHVATESFSGFTVDTSFRTQTVTTPVLSLRQIGPGTFRNIVDVNPFEFSENNGTNHAAIWTDFGSTTVEMGFAAPVFAWGGDFYDQQPGELLNMDLVDESGSVVATVEVPSGNRFFGFVTSPTTRLSKVVFRSRTFWSLGGEGFGLDDVSTAGEAPASPAHLPEPGSLGLFLAGLAGWGAFRRRGA